MSEPDPLEEFPSLMERARQRDPEAINALVEEYVDHIQAVVQRRLQIDQRPRLRRLFDCSDFVQMVLESFFCKRIHEALLESPKELRAYLAKMAANMVALAERDHLKRQ